MLAFQVDQLFIYIKSKSEFRKFIDLHTREIPSKADRQKALLG